MRSLKSRSTPVLSYFYLLISLLPMAMLTGENIGCTQPVPQSAVAAPLRESAEQVRVRAEATFQRAIFYKPREDSMTGLEKTFAPLIVQEADSGDDPPDPYPFGAIVGEDVSLRVDSSLPTLYAETFTTRVNGTVHDQVVYFWRYPSRQNEPGIVSLEGRGVRITLGSDGFPLLWEASSTATDTRIIFVSESLEAAARRDFGDPLPGRRYAIERSLEESPNTIVARVLDDGPVPMGPYVYLSVPPRRAVTTVLCRCMTSQVNEFVETRYYDLVPFEAIKELGDASRRAGTDPPRPRVYWGGTLSYWNLRIPREEMPLEQLLRWPKGL